MGLFERYLSLWVGLGMGVGVGLGLTLPGLFEAVAALEVAHVNVVVAVASRSLVAVKTMSR